MSSWSYLITTEPLQFLPRVTLAHAHTARPATTSTTATTCSARGGAATWCWYDDPHVVRRMIQIVTATTPVVTHPSDDQRPPRPQNNRGGRPQNRNGDRNSQGNGQRQGQAPQRNQGQRNQGARPAATVAPVQAGAPHPHARPANTNPHKPQQAKPVHQGPRNQGRPEQRPQTAAPRALGTFGDLVAGLSSRSAPDELDATNEAPRRERGNRR